MGEEQFNDDETLWNLMAESFDNKSDDERLKKEEAQADVMSFGDRDTHKSGA